ncbi:MAG: hypothetical protein QOF68_65, partial [Gaiellales bacterium]|nr:hypothetical protein [Gaiellales bacterium]
MAAGSSISYAAAIMLAPVMGGANPPYSSAQTAPM